jgi:SNF2 family DNA or RNA helicase
MAERMGTRGKSTAEKPSQKPKSKWSGGESSKKSTSKKASPAQKQRASSPTKSKAKPAPKIPKLGKNRIADSPVANKQTREAYEAAKTPERMAYELSLIPKPLRKAHEEKPLYGHQLITLDLYRKSNLVLDFGDPGVGKTRTALQAFSERRRLGGGRLLVIAPKTLLESAWGADIQEFCGDMRYAVAWAGAQRERAFDSGADIVIINTDGVKWLLDEGLHFLEGADPFDSLVIDELTSFKIASSDRSKAMRKMAKVFTYKAGLTGTPNPRSITDVHHQVLIIDNGVRLGESFYRFQTATCSPIQNGPHPKMVVWVDKPGIEEVVAGMLADICVRHRFEDCMDIPPNKITMVQFHPPAKLLKHYKEMEQRATLSTKDGKATGVNAATLRNKLLQIASGAVYGEQDMRGLKATLVLDQSRSQLVMDLIEERPWASVVFFNWGHQKEQLLKLAKTRGIPHAVIDSTTPDRDRAKIRQKYQDGDYKFILMHPATGAHGLTLTKGRTTIFISPTERADFLKQGIHRVYRGGQTEKTETLLIEAEGTVEALRYEQLQGKTERMNNLLGLLQYADDQEVTDERFYPTDV